jgi:hypothetical protein
VLRKQEKAKTASGYVPHVIKRQTCNNDAITHLSIAGTNDTKRHRQGRVKEELFAEMKLST